LRQILLVRTLSTAGPARLLAELRFPNILRLMLTCLIIEIYTLGTPDQTRPVHQRQDHMSACNLLRVMGTE
jgi:hypothetical protein